MDRGAQQVAKSPWCCKESDMTAQLTLSLFTFFQTQTASATQTVKVITNSYITSSLSSEMPNSN